MVVVLRCRDHCYHFSFFLLLILDFHLKFLQVVETLVAASSRAQRKTPSRFLSQKGFSNLLANLNPDLKS